MRRATCPWRPLSRSCRSPPRIRAALVGRPNDARALLDITVAFEGGRWADARKLAEAQKVDPDRLPAAYAEALRWTRELQVGALALAG